MMISWRAPEFVYYKKDVGWYWLIAIIAILILAVSLWQKNFLFAVFIVLAAGTLITWGKRQPQQLTIELNDEGLMIGKEFHPKEKFSHFYLKKEEAAWDKLIMKTKSKISPYLIVPLPRQKFDSVKKYCLNFWTEMEEFNEPLVDQLGDFLKF